MCDLCRRRFWKGDYTEDKIAAYQTLYRCLMTVSKLASPIAPFYSDQLFKDLSSVTNAKNEESVHLETFPEVNSSEIDEDLEVRMGYAQKISSLVLSLRKKENIKVRQPLQKIMVPVLDDEFTSQLAAISDLIKSEVNVKEVEALTDTEGVLVKNIKPNFKALGPKYGKHMKAIAGAVNQFTADDISSIEQNGNYDLNINGETITIDLTDVEITSQDIPGWLVASEGKLTVALDVTLTNELKEEGLAREFVNRIQNIRKESGLEVTDKISLKILNNELINLAVTNNKKYICDETLANSLELVDVLDSGNFVDLGDGTETTIALQKLN